MPETVAFASFETPIGRHWLAASSLGVLAITRGDGPMELLDDVARLTPGAVPQPDPERLEGTIHQLRAYFDGESDLLDLPLDTRSARPFDIAVWNAVRAIPFGSTASYGEIAVAVGRPRAARAVGGAMARCPVGPVVPCHRVIHADGSVGGWGGDMGTKRWLLDLERRPTGRLRSG